MKRKRRGKEGNNSKKRRCRIVILFILLVILFIGMMSIFIDSKSIVGIRKLPLKVLVMKNVGIGFEKESVFFGGVPSGGTSKRQIVIANYNNYGLKVSIVIEGGIRRWINIEDDEFILEGGEERILDFLVVIPEDEEEGEYNGNALIVFRSIPEKSQKVLNE